MDEDEAYWRLLWFMEDWNMSLAPVQMDLKDERFGALFTLFNWRLLGLKKDPMSRRM